MKQECIPLGYETPALYRMRVSLQGRSLFSGSSVKGFSVQGGPLSRGALCRGGALCKGGALSRGVSVQEDSLSRETTPTVDRQTPVKEIITLPQFRWRAVNIRIFEHNINKVSRAFYISLNVNQP